MSFRFLVGRIIMSKTVPATMLRREGDSIDEDVVTAIAAYFISESEESIVPLIRTIDATLSQIRKFNKYRRGEDLDVSGDGWDRRSDEDHDEPPVDSFSKISLKGPITITNNTVTAASNDSKTQTMKASSGKGDLRGSRRALGILEPNISLLTEEAVYHHTKNAQIEEIQLLHMIRLNMI